MAEDKYQKVLELAKRRGFFWPSYEIYGGVAGFYDMGPYGILLKNRIIEKWRQYFVRDHSNYVIEIESPIIGPSKVYEASGHVENFTDPIVECTRCGRKFRADHLIKDKLGIDVEGLSPREMTRIIRENNIKCPVCGGELGEVKTFNLLFKTHIGPYEGNIGYFRPELAQGMFVAFKRVYEVMRSRMPLGIAQVGRVGRNEISPRQAMMRLREFTIMEMEYFIDPEDNEKSCPFFERHASTKIRILPYKYKVEERDPEEVTVREAVEEKLILHPCLGYWMAVSNEFIASLGIPRNEIYFEEKGPHERAHYSSQTFDQLVRVSRWGWVEVSGHSYRGDYDLSRHMQYSGQDLTVFKPFDEPKIVEKTRYIVDKSYIGRTFKSEAKKVFELLANIPEEELKNAYLQKKPLKVGDYEIPPNAILEYKTREKITGKKYIPHVIEPSFGVERVTYVVFEHAYREKEGRIILSLPRDIAPVQAVVLPLIEKDDDLRKTALEIYDNLRRAGFYALYDDSGSIGRRYARYDEIGVPAAITVDYQTLEDSTVTLRDRDSWRQVRIPIASIVDILRKFIYSGEEIDKLGTPINA
ncbi:MAG: glycine--tRNA ligase [Desulfurococcales archaeon]|nr:glycine--tRNA ligase [Desulfurococcales archaeon]